MKREEFIKWAEARGWEMDRFGHLQRARLEKPETEMNETVPRYVHYRYKLSRIAVRYEVKTGVGIGGRWVRLRSGYFSKLSIGLDGILKGLRR